MKRHINESDYRRIVKLVLEEKEETNIGFFKKESVSKELISAKNYLFFDKKPDIAIVGDCSALHSIKPKIINQYFCLSDSCFKKPTKNSPTISDLSFLIGS